MESVEGTFKSIEAAKQFPKAVKVLELENQGLTAIPLEIFDFPNLHTLILQDNLLTDLPIEFANVPVVRLNLRGNRFNEFPAVLCHLRKLEELEIAANNIRELPEDLNFLAEKLTFLNLKDNLLDEDWEVFAIESLPKTDITFSMVKSYDPSRPKDRNWTHIDDKAPFNWREFLSWSALPVLVIVLTLLLRVVYLNTAPDPFPEAPSMEGLNLEEVLPQ